MKPELLKHYVALLEKISNPDLPFMVGEVRDHETQEWSGDFAGLVPVKDLGVSAGDLRPLIEVLEKSVAYQYSVAEAFVEAHIKDFQVKVGELDTNAWTEKVVEDPPQIFFELQYNQDEWFLFFTVPSCIVARVLDQTMQTIAGEGTV